MTSVLRPPSSGRDSSQNNAASLPLKALSPVTPAVMSSALIGDGQLP